MRYVFVLFIALSAPLASAAGQQRVVLAVENMTCAVCPITVKKALEKVRGVARVAVDYERATAIVDFDSEKVAPDDLIKATTNAGYPSRVRN